ncbi:MAG: heat-inducible transcription repressor HrcA [Candidatus Thermofonsia Clade 1 bacterium]|jgi:heat-inducible transcriptional repressor|uniref:Heat-inducible transcription repressor HrcA n=1 Tax=Candidatus Thermofonsia Clade 1 bacterium TaxID=2364210 RepID=A0A2M8PEF2_9CHLR|nr:MAG: heat-inducible transcription repressor HrcA [Candidatus Thermofonsia Clade 1 bacterium]PJF42806.1 MAG: heat-inducible transcription repressor HrcA [Candidatus Thermofonsia Clade 1 bacterium]
MVDRDLDAAGLPELTERQEKILALIIREYTNKPEPVGSKFLAETYLSNLSSATIRNEMARLEELGLLAAPHTSAGRVPTEVGYRYFVRRLLSDELPPDEKQALDSAFAPVANDLESGLRLAAALMARKAQGAALVTSPRAVNCQYKHLALLATQGRVVMMVLVLHGGEVRQQMLTLAEVPSQEQLSALADQLNALCEGLNAEQVRSRAKQVENELAREIIEVIADVMEEADRAPMRFTYREGLSEMLTLFTERIGVQQAIRAIEEPQVLQAIVAELPDQAIGEVRVVIGGEGRWQDIQHLGMVISRYGVPEQTTGALMVLGPTRMRYGRAVATVRYIAGLISGMLLTIYSESAERHDND